MNEERNTYKKSYQIPLKIEKSKNYYLFNSEYFFKEFTASELQIIENILNIQKIEPLQLKDLLECEGALMNSPLIQKNF